MPTYDVHTHVGLDQGFYLRGWRPYAAWAQDLLEHMDAHGIDRAVCFPFTLPSAFDAFAFADQGPRRTAARPCAVRPRERHARPRDRRSRSPRAAVSAGHDRPDPLRERAIGQPGTAGRAHFGTQAAVHHHRVARAQPAEHRPRAAGVRRVAAICPCCFTPRSGRQAPHAQVVDCFAVAEAFPAVRFDLAHSLAFHAGYLRQASQMPNVWVDCAALLAHCELARQNSPIIAAPADRLDADYTRPEQVLEAIHAILGDHFMWGSDNPFMSWCDDQLRLLYSYADEAEVLQGPAGSRPQGHLQRRPGGLAVRPERKQAVITLKGHAALVTGSTKGVGRAIAIAMAEAGADVVIHGRAISDEARETMERCKRHGVKVAFVGGRPVRAHGVLVEAGVQRRDRGASRASISWSTTRASTSTCRTWRWTSNGSRRPCG